ncbi:MAG: type I methionyl aminopeptidase [Candidatus Levybacteria bacterium]|nr:type I methionyl aminopeptidase [Candidatus Levybacteria bacterium]
MIKVKSKKELEIMAQGGAILAGVLKKVLEQAKPGILELELDALAERLILEKGAEPAFKKVKEYHHATCISTNDAVVHGVPSGYVLKEGDVVGVDCGVYYKGLYTDMAETVQVKSSKLKVQSDGVDVFLETGERALEEAIKAAMVGNRIGHISKAIQDIIEQTGYSVVRSLVGHGVGKELHEEPEIPGFLDDTDISDTPILKEGMTLAIEVIYNMGKNGVIHSSKDGWTIKTEDGSISATFEKTIAVTGVGPVILTV